MNEFDQLMWRALEGALGSEKTATVRYAPLTALIGHDNQAEEYTLAHAAGHMAKQAAFVRAENDAIMSGLQALRYVLPEKTAATKHVAKAGGSILGDISKNPTVRDMGKKMLGGAAMTAGAAPVAYVAGDFISDRAAENARDRAIQAVGAGAAIGTAAYGASQFMKRDPYGY